MYLTCKHDPNIYKYLCRLLKKGRRRGANADRVEGKSDGGLEGEFIASTCNMHSTIITELLMLARRRRRKF